jgi:hypothetical protein
MQSGFGTDFISGRADFRVKPVLILEPGADGNDRARLLTSGIAEVRAEYKT